MKHISLIRYRRSTHFHNQLIVPNNIILFFSIFFSYKLVIFITTIDTSNSFQELSQNAGKTRGIRSLTQVTWLETILTLVSSWILIKSKSIIIIYTLPFGMLEQNILHWIKYQDIELNTYFQIRSSQRHKLCTIFTEKKKKVVKLVINKCKKMP